MTTPQLITYEEASPLVTWFNAVSALRKGHRLPKAQVSDIFLGPSDGSLLSRGAYIKGLGFGVKSVTVFGDNPAANLPTVQGAMLVFDPAHGQINAIIESKLVTELKTAADSVLGALLLARPNSETLLIVGAGTVACSLIHAYTATFPSIRRVLVWARRAEQAVAVAGDVRVQGVKIAAAADLETAAAEADIISTATMAREPVLRRAWIRPGTHVDLIGAFKADMREADDALISEGSVFVDSRDTTIDHIGELKIPIASGVITADAVRGDLYDLVGNAATGRETAAEITVFKNGGGAHLDLMIADYIAKVVTEATAVA
ncbi:ornithine cyclodeaminase family protein [Pelagibacterium sediminicola]|uniref:ornithine cyclodeaminase family protein n=1 Tax=Pelagibacterium sediminicola TaxID=2248761 RepID=UPI000E315D0E|nr:ornithine cyclodeaminase [Pelagibacterium sediminicola]